MDQLHLQPQSNTFSTILQSAVREAHKNYFPTPYSNPLYSDPMRMASDPAPIGVIVSNHSKEAPKVAIPQILKKDPELILKERAAKVVRLESVVARLTIRRDSKHPSIICYSNYNILMLGKDPLVEGECVLDSGTVLSRENIQICRPVEEIENPVEKKHKKPAAKQSIACGLCAKSFASAFQLREHHSIFHLKERNFVCEICGTTFGRRGGLRRHIQMVHQNHTYKCSYAECGHPGYKCSKALAAHVRSVHTNDRPFICDVCSKAFVRRNDLKMHHITHSKELVFECRCGMKFRRLVYLKKHEKNCVHCKAEIAPATKRDVAPEARPKVAPVALSPTTPRITVKFAIPAIPGITVVKSDDKSKESKE